MYSGHGCAGERHKALYSSTSSAPWLAILQQTSDMTTDQKQAPKKPRYFERPDPGERPLTFLETVTIVLASHLGVRTRKQREEDFRRANGLHLFIVGVIYFVLIVAGLVLLANYIGAAVSAR